MAEAFDHKSFLASLSRRPGVYQMYDADGRLLYVGITRARYSLTRPAISSADTLRPALSKRTTPSYGSAFSPLLDRHIWSA